MKQMGKKSNRGLVKLNKVYSLQVNISLINNENNIKATEKLIAEHIL